MKNAITILLSGILFISLSNVFASPQHINSVPAYKLAKTNCVISPNHYSVLLLSSNPTDDYLSLKDKPLFRVLWQAMLGGLLAVFTPYVYAILPVTVSYLTVAGKKRRKWQVNSLVFALSLLLIFVTLGFLISLLIGSTGLDRLTKNWIFNLVFCRIFLMLGLSFLGAFEINLPSRALRAMDSKSGANSFKGIFFLALTLPLVTISSTGPIVGLVLLMAGKGGIAGPVVGMFGFAIGFGLPFVLPQIINIVSKSIHWLNHVKVLLGFFSLLMGLKFLSNADVALGWNLLDHDVFLIMWMFLAVMMGVYMLGYVRLSNDYLHSKNVYGQEYTSISQLFLAVAFFSFALYLLPGLWGAPLHRINGFLPPH